VARLWETRALVTMLLVAAGTNVDAKTIVLDGLDTAVVTGAAAAGEGEGVLKLRPKATPPPGAVDNAGASERLFQAGGGEYGDADEKFGARPALEATPSLAPPVDPEELLVHPGDAEALEAKSFPKPGDVAWRAATGILPPGKSSNRALLSKMGASTGFQPGIGGSGVMLLFMASNS